MAYQLQSEQWVPFPLHQVFLFFANPQNLPRIMPPALGAILSRLELQPPPRTSGIESTAGLAGVGSGIVVSVKVVPFLPIRAPWVARIVEFEWDQYFVDIQEKGPFKSWRHRHGFKAEERNGVSGTLVGDFVEYEIGFGPFGAMAQKILVGRQMQATFAHRQKILESLLQ